jgi:hypothetical protein
VPKNRPLLVCRPARAAQPRLPSALPRHLAPGLGGAV